MIARQPIASGAQITATTPNGGLTGTVTMSRFYRQRAIAVRVDQISGVGTASRTATTSTRSSGSLRSSSCRRRAGGNQGVATRAGTQRRDDQGPSRACARALLPPVALPAEEAPAASGRPTPPPERPP